TQSHSWLSLGRSASTRGRSTAVPPLTRWNLAVGPLVPRRVAPVGRVPKNRSNGAPLGAGVRRPVAIARRGDAVAVQPRGDRAVAPAELDAFAEDPDDDGDARGGRGDQMRRVPLARVKSGPKPGGAPRGLRG